LGKVLLGCCCESCLCVRPKGHVERVQKMLIQQSLQKYFYVEVSFIGISDNAILMYLSKHNGKRRWRGIICDKEI
jgi:hypothetical protein